MIALLRGHLLQKEATRLIVDVQGVGYEVLVPLSTFYQLPDPHGEVTLRIHTHVREDAILLFGFLTVLEQQLFERLIAISGIGPRLALSVLSGIEPLELARAVQAGDVHRLTRIPGVGKKTAERIGLELKDRLPPELVAMSAGADVAAAGGVLRADLLSALLNLGYHRPLADKAVDAALEAEGEGATFERTLKRALQHVAR